LHVIVLEHTMGQYLGWHGWECDIICS